jgi:hypothetical protein
VPQAAASTSGATAAKATRAAKTAQSTTAKAQPQLFRSLSLSQRVGVHKQNAHRFRSTLRFFRNHPGLLRSVEHRPIARAAVRRASRGLERSAHSIDALQHEIARRQAHRLAKASPRTAICQVFGRYCQEALAVAQCESGHSTTAQNGQYLGLFQMGSYERSMFGHGATAYAQARAAHEYFLLSGRDWSPWSCKPSY